MNFYVLTLFKDMITDGLNHSIIKRGLEKGAISIEAVDIRDFSKDKHRRVDDYGYGDGVGMIMQPEPIYDAYKYVKDKISGGARVIYMSPQGEPFSQKKAEELSKEENLIILCGHYEGIDQRVLDIMEVEEISIGDFILTGGELGAMAVIDAVSRLIPGVLNKEESFQDESFSDGLLEYPQYTRPYEFMGKTVPDILLSGHHENIAKWKREQKLINTLKKRPDLLELAELSEKEKIFINELKNKS